MKDNRLQKIAGIAIPVVAVSMILYHLVFTRTLFEGPIEHQNTHLMFALLLVFLGTLKKKPKLWWWVLLLIVLSLVTTSYIRLLYGDLEQRLLATTTDLIIGILLMFVCLEATRHSFGLALPIVALIFVAYVFLGQYLPHPLWHLPTPLTFGISSYNVGLTGMYGTALSMSADYIFLFVVFGAFLGASGAMTFFIQVGRLIGRRLSSGAGMTAVISSALVGMVTGQGSTNVAISGPFTIPIMKKAGYTATQAAAIETVAGTGGNIMPPVLGIAAFLMAEYIQIPYIQVCAMSIIPAIIYYSCLAAYVHLSAAKMKIARLTEAIDYRGMLKTSYLFLVPITLLVVLLSMGYTLMYVSFVLPISVLLLSLIRKETRGSFKKWLQACVDGANVGATIAVATSVVGIIVASVDITGVGNLFPMLVEEWSGGNLAIAVVLVAVITLFLGCALPPFASYMTVAMLCAPVLVRLGLPLIPTHYFLFLFAVFALITPPVALTAMVAAPLAGANYMKTAVESVKAGLISWLLPFFVIWSPGIILQPQNPLEMATKLIASFATVILLQTSMVGYYLVGLSASERIIALLSAVGLVIFIATTNYIFLAIGLVIGAFLTLWQQRKKVLNRTLAKTAI